MLHRHDRDTNVDVAASDPQPGGAVLRQPTLGDVEVRDDLDARNHGLRQHAGRRRDRPQQAVNSHADHEPGLKGFDVNIARAQLDGFFQEIVDGADHRRTAGKIAQTFDVVFARLMQSTAGAELDTSSPRRRSSTTVRSSTDATVIVTSRRSTISAARRAAVSVGSATASTAPPSAD